jgi:hypothetical protein
MLKHWPKKKSVFKAGLVASQMGDRTFRPRLLTSATKVYSVFSIRVGIQYHAMALDTYTDTECERQAKLRKRLKKWVDKGLESIEITSGFYL